MTRPCECGLDWRPKRLFGLLTEPVNGAPCFFTGSIALGGCGLPSTDSLSGPVSASKGKIQGGGSPASTAPDDLRFGPKFMPLRAAWGV